MFFGSLDGATKDTECLESLVDEGLGSLGTREGVRADRGWRGLQRLDRQYQAVDEAYVLSVAPPECRDLASAHGGDGEVGVLNTRGKIRR